MWFFSGVLPFPDVHETAAHPAAARPNGSSQLLSWAPGATSARFLADDRTLCLGKAPCGVGESCSHY